MKNLYKLIGILLVTMILLVSISCKEDDSIKKGGTIMVYNSTANPSWVNVYKGSLDLWNEIKDSVKEGEGTLVAPSSTQPFTMDEDGFYLITAIPPVGFYDTVILFAGSTSKVTIK